MKDHDTTMIGDRWGFPDTMWGVILNAKRRDSKQYKRLLGELITMYWMPVYKYIRIAWSKSNEEAKDLTQEFFVKFLEKDFLHLVDPEKGRFRTYVKASLNNFVINYAKKATRKKRGGSFIKSLDSDTMDIESVKSPESSDPVDIFDKEWARTVVTRSVEQLKKILYSQNKENYFAVFSAYYDATEDSSTSSHKEIASQLRIKETDVNNYLNYTRAILKKIIKREVSKYVLEKADVDEEIKYLLSIRF
ncbi:MAG: sigma-70 family RNA polymerase sigma factor [Planctomycetes bacterium]|nr:sigma-70 family RNA polymerase sigma factor [Planctomycetota bacterium]